MTAKITYTHKLHYDGKRHKERLVKVEKLPTNDEAQAIVSSWWRCDRSMIGIVSVEEYTERRAMTHEEILAKHGIKE